VNLVWRTVPAALQPYGLLWELIDDDPRFWMSPVYADICRPGKRRYTARAFPYMLTTGGPPAEKSFRSLTQAKAWAQATTLLSSD
jgi:hypothetical protein